MISEYRKIKVLYTIPNFDTAGSGKVLYDLANGLDKNTFDVEIACTHNRGKFFKEVETLGFPIHLVQTTISYRPYHSLIRRLRPIKKLIKENKYDIVHSWHWSSDWTEALATRSARAKWVYTKKAMSWGNKHWKIRSFMAHFIVTINNEMKMYFPKKKNQKLIPLGLDVNYYSPSPFKADKKRTSFQIVTVANLVPVKGIEVLLRAMHHIKDFEIQLKVVGDNRDPYAETLYQLTKGLGLEVQVTFLGKQPDVRPYLAEADVFVIPTLDKGRREGMPMALVEAMSMGTPVLGSNISGIKYVLKDFSNLLFEAGDYKALAIKIKELKDNQSELINIGSELREYCIQHFSMEQFIESHESLYRSLV